MIEPTFIVAYEEHDGTASSFQLEECKLGFINESKARCFRQSFQSTFLNLRHDLKDYSCGRSEGRAITITYNVLVLVSCCFLFVGLPIIINYCLLIK